jgi:hypothetical protein
MQPPRPCPKWAPKTRKTLFGRLQFPACGSSIPFLACRRATQRVRSFAGSPEIACGLADAVPCEWRRYTPAGGRSGVSRERLPWGEHPEWRYDLNGNQHLLGGLADKDADDFLKLIPIADEAVRKAIIEGAREGSDRAAGVYPLMLDLQVEHWRSLFVKRQVSPDRFTVLAQTFEARCIEIVERVLR